MSRCTRAVIAWATAAVLAVSAPAAGLANAGGQPHSTTPCPTQSHGGKHNGATHGKHKGALRGKKCGLR